MQIEPMTASDADAVLAMYQAGNPLGTWFPSPSSPLHARVAAAGPPAPMRLFHLSIAYLTLLFAVIADPAMLAHHRDLGITADQRFRFASLMSLAADDAGLPDDPEFRAALVCYLEWGTRLAMYNSQPGAEVVQQAPVPRWGWEWPPVPAVGAIFCTRRDEYAVRSASECRQAVASSGDYRQTSRRPCHRSTRRRGRGVRRRDTRRLR